MYSFNDLRHCDTCTCTPPVPATFISGVQHLPADVNREVTETLRNGETVRYRPIEHLTWKPAKYQIPEIRVIRYKLLLREGHARNLREAVKMLAAKRREWEAAETAEHASRLRDKYTGRPDAYTRALPRKKDLIRAEAQEICSYCGAPGSRDVDHMMPISRGGDHRRKNLTCACRACNREKNARTPAEWKAARLKAGRPWPPQHQDQLQASGPPGLTAIRVSDVQTELLRIVADGLLERTEMDGYAFRSLRALERRGLIEHGRAIRRSYVITDRGRTALETGRIPV